MPLTEFPCETAESPQLLRQFLLSRDTTPLILQLLLCFWRSPQTPGHFHKHLVILSLKTHMPMQQATSPVKSYFWQSGCLIVSLQLPPYTL